MTACDVIQKTLQESCHINVMFTRFDMNFIQLEIEPLGVIMRYYYECVD